VLIACWSSKGGSGTTVVSAALSLVHAEASSRGAVLADLCGDAPAVLGIAEPQGPGIADWLAAGPDVPADGLARLEVEAAPGLKLLPRGELPLVASRIPALAELLAADGRTVVADCGTTADAAAHALVEGATVSLLVVRPCFLALRRALVAPHRPTGVVLLDEPGRALGRRDVEELLGVPVRARVECAPEMARLVDAGLLSRGLPRRVARALRGAV
jgi:MinD-like ATPase involved in chromosome partitioning or flagellar assembly